MGHPSDNDGTIPDTELHRIRQSGFLNQRLGQSDASGIAYTNQVGLHHDTSLEVVCEYIIITQEEPVNEMSGSRQ
jgi:hypothetical protein